MPLPELPSDVRELPLVVRVKMAADRAAARAVEEHRRAGVPLVFWRDGKVVLVSAEELVPSPKKDDGHNGAGAARDRASE
jgi:hypothetical protein